MFNRKLTKICITGIIISMIILLVVFLMTDSITGEKEFSEYTSDDWKIAIVPLITMALSLLSTIVFSLIIIIPYIIALPKLDYYLKFEKFSDIDENTDFLVFDHNELKRTCCSCVGINGLDISVKEYDLKNKKWKCLENNRHLEDRDALVYILLNDYHYDRVKFFAL